jgi:hypothetical protein
LKAVSGRSTNRTNISPSEGDCKTPFWPTIYQSYQAIEFSGDNQNWDIIEDEIVGEGGVIKRLYSKQNFPAGLFRVEQKY